MRHVWISVVALLTANAACISTYQSARMLPKGKTSVTAGVTNVRGGEDGELTEGSLDVPDVMVRHAVSDKVELGFRYSAITEGKSYTVDAKFSVSKDRAALSIPIGVAYGDSETCCTHIAPTFIWSAPAGASELTGSVKFISIFEEGESELLVGSTLGLRLSTEHSAWAFHPEVGILLNPGEDGYMLSLGAAFVVNM